MWSGISRHNPGRVKVYYGINYGTYCGSGRQSVEVSIIQSAKTGSQLGSLCKDVSTSATVARRVVSIFNLFQDGKRADENIRHQ